MDRLTSTDRINGPTNWINGLFAQVCGRIRVLRVCAIAIDGPPPLDPGLSLFKICTTKINGPIHLIPRR